MPRGNHTYGILARLKADVSLGQAQAEITGIAPRLASSRLATLLHAINNSSPTAPSSTINAGRIRPLTMPLIRITSHRCRHRWPDTPAQTGIIFSGIPALRASRVDLNDALKAGGGKGISGDTSQRAYVSFFIRRNLLHHTEEYPRPSAVLTALLVFEVALAVVIFVTLILQGLTLPALIRWLKVTEGPLERCEELEARRILGRHARRRGAGRRRLAPVNNIVRTSDTG